MSRRELARAARALAKRKPNAAKPRENNIDSSGSADDASGEGDGDPGPSNGRRLNIVYLPTASLRPSPRNVRTRSKKQVHQLVRSITENGGMSSPIVCDEWREIIAGHGRLMAAKQLGMATVPVIVLRGLTDIQKRRLRIADNKIASNAGTDVQKLVVELEDIISLPDFDPDVLGFEVPELDILFSDHEVSVADPADVPPEPQKTIVSAKRDVWLMGEHRILCGDSLEDSSFQRLMGAEAADMLFTDPPFDLKIKSLVGRGKIKHAEFAMGSGEMGREKFGVFLEDTLGNAARYSRDGAIEMVCMDWRHIDLLMEVGRKIYGDGNMLNLVVWAKSNGGQGSFYRSQHELIAVFRNGDSPHMNNIELGRHGRNRTNVWHYPGVNAFGKGRMQALSDHPTAKNVSMIVDAIKDCTKRGDIVLDAFGGSGTTLMAAERTGRKARIIEFEPRFVDVTVRRWQAETRRDAFHAETGLTFNETEARAKREAE